MSKFLGYQSYSSLYQNVILYGPQPVNGNAARGLNRRKKVASRSKRAAKNHKQQIQNPSSVPDSQFGMPAVINGVRVYFVPCGTLSKRNLK